jgi:hypothetical protein
MQNEPVGPNCVKEQLIRPESNLWSNKELTAIYYISTTLLPRRLSSAARRLWARSGATWPRGGLLLQSLLGLDRLDAQPESREGICDQVEIVFIRFFPLLGFFFMVPEVNAAAVGWA